MFLNSVFKQTGIFKEIEGALKSNSFPINLTGLNPTLKALIIAAEESSCTVVTADAAESNLLYRELKSLGKNAVILEARDFNLRGTATYSKEYEHKRINTLSKVIDGDFDVLLLDTECLTQRCISKSELTHNKIVLKVNEDSVLEDLIEQLISMGYIKAGQVEGPGQFSKRGDILDVFSPGLENPIRIDFFGDTVERISSFEVISQRRLENLNTITFLPATERGAVDLDALNKFLKSIKNKNQKLYDIIDSDIAKNDLMQDRYMAFYKNAASTVFDYFCGNLYISEYRGVINRVKTLTDSRNIDKLALIEEGYINKKTDCFYLNKAEVIEGIKNCKVIYLDAFLSSKNDFPPKALINADVKGLPIFSGNTEQLANDILEYNAGLTIVLTTSEKSSNALAGILNNKSIKANVLYDKEIPHKGKYLAVGALNTSLYFEKDDILIIAQGEKTEYKRKKRFKGGKAINSLDELKVGDYVVHYSHGIGIFDGIHSLKNDNIIKDYIKIKYKGNDVLYVPVTQLDLVSKYIGTNVDGKVTVHKLGGVEWQKATTRVKTAVKEMAKELAELYAKRLNEKGHSFLPDTTMQNDFEDLFDYEETEDQLRAAYEIKSDMEKSKPMDRLFCGDVGFGKTEVALRAAFKCIDGGKQCAILVPTTLLANQHFVTAESRFAAFPINIELLSRYKTKKQIEKSLTNIRRGTADLVVGTHRMISKDVQFKDLGLLIIDEEQRFGVAQKERLKALFPTVDILTLSATPIPRTLNMAMSGIRDMSSIEEPPQDRKPVQTYVIEEDMGVIIEAINKELRRGGQVFYLHNRVDSIYSTAAKLSSLMPEAKVGVAHGKMSEDELTGVWNDLLEHKIDVLVCTTIIETGVDVSNANTLIVEDADRYGLAQLHQIRGRVGRSPRRAYAYFCFKKGKSLTDIAEKRLSALREFTEFGSGFKIALRDLEIRGAGNILGSEQHGHMEAVGYDMYIKLLNQAVNKIKGVETVEELSCTVDLNISASIPEDYIPFITARLGMYKRIADIKNKDDALDVIDELNDRFGTPPERVLGLIDVALIRGAAARNGICEIIQSSDKVKLNIKDFNLEKAALLVDKIGEGATLSLRDISSIIVNVPKHETVLSVLKRISEKL